MAIQNTGERRRLILRLLSALLISAPFSIVATILLLPLWKWIEATTGMESIGHSGPAEWCYVAVFLILATGASLVVFAKAGR